MAQEIRIWFNVPEGSTTPPQKYHIASLDFDNGTYRYFETTAALEEFAASQNERLVQVADYPQGEIEMAEMIENIRPIPSEFSVAGMPPLVIVGGIAALAMLFIPSKRVRR